MNHNVIIQNVQLNSPYQASNWIKFCVWCIVVVGKCTHFYIYRIWKRNMYIQLVASSVGCWRLYCSLFALPITTMERTEKKSQTNWNMNRVDKQSIVVKDFNSHWAILSDIFVIVFNSGNFFFSHHRNDAIWFMCELKFIIVNSIEQIDLVYQCLHFETTNYFYYSEIRKFTYFNYSQCEVPVFYSSFLFQYWPQNCLILDSIIASVRKQVICRQS